MLNITPFGWFHTAISLVSLFGGLYALLRYHDIRYATTLGFKLGFGGACTFDTARQLRRLATELPLSALVLETDAPDIPPQWLYVTAAEREAGRAQGVNSPLELPRIGAVVAGLRNIPVEHMAQASTTNALAALPGLQALEPVT